MITVISTTKFDYFEDMKAANETKVKKSAHIAISIPSSDLIKSIPTITTTRHIVEVVVEYSEDDPTVEVNRSITFKELYTDPYKLPDEQVDYIKSQPLSVVEDIEFITGILLAENNVEKDTDFGKLTFVNEEDFHANILPNIEI